MHRALRLCSVGKLLRRNGVELAALWTGLTLALVTAAKISVTTDEPKHLVNGLYFAKTGSCCLHDEPPLAILHAWSLAQYDQALPEVPSGFRPERVYTNTTPSRFWFVFSPRIPTCIAFALLIVIVWCWSRRLFPAGCSWVPVVLCAACPTLIAHGSVCTEDIFLTTSTCFAFYRLYRYLQRPTRLGALLVGVAMGLVYVSKLSSPAVHIALVAAWLVGATRRTVRAQLRRRDWALDAISMLLVPLLLLNVGYLFEGTGTTLRELELVSPQMKDLASSPLGGIPLPVPRGFVHAIDYSRYDIINRALTGNNYYLFGETYRTGHKYYFLVAFLLKTSTITLLLGGLGIVVWWRSHRRESSHITLWLFPVLYLLFNSWQNVFHIGVRYILPIYPFFILMTGYACRRIEHRAWWRLAAIVPAGIAMAQFPNYIGYFNISSFFRPKADMLVDSNLDWGQLNYLVEEDLVKVTDPGGWLMPPLLWMGGEWPRPTNYFGTFYVSPTSRQLSRPPWINLLRDPQPARMLGDTIAVYEVRTDDQFAVRFINDWWVTDDFENPAVNTWTKAPSAAEIRELVMAWPTSPVHVSSGHLQRSPESVKRCFLARPAYPLRGEVLYSADDIAYIYDERFALVDADRTPGPAVLPERSFIASDSHSYLFLVCNLTGEGGLVAATREHDGEVTKPAR